MARKRSKNKPRQDNTQVEHNGNNATSTRRETRIMPLSNDRIREIYAKRRTKGQYQTFLAALLESGDNGCDVKETWPQLQDKKASTIKQGFENAKNTKDAPEGADAVDVIVDGEDVFLINTSVANVDLAEATA
jgi:hypothetical protein